MTPKLPIGIQNLREMRTQGYAYVDKTPHIARLVDEGKYYFLSRPRRFGKSLLVDTLACAFAGERALFAGLYLDTHWDWERRYPVVRFDFGEGVLDSRERLEGKIRFQLDANAIEHEVNLDQTDSSSRFHQLIDAVARRVGERVVLLIDEYDKPILDNLEDPGRATVMREGLKNLYSVIKGLDAHLKFVLLTGVSKFSKVSLFSGLNNLKDITLDQRYATLCGYTQAELETTFAAYLDGVDLDMLQAWYNGYNFLGESVYNPFDVLLYLDQREFRPFWFETGTPNFLIERLRQRRVSLPDLTDRWLDAELLGSFDVDLIEPETLLFQAGYLTIHDRTFEFDSYRYRLGYPNKEVRISLPRAVLHRYVPDPMAQEQTRDRLGQALKQDDPDALYRALHAFFASIPHDWYRKNRLAEYEAYYASLVYCYFAALGVDVRPEEPSAHGQADLCIRYQHLIWLLEFKLDESGPDQALAQIKAKGYHHRFAGQSVTLIGIDFDRAQRNISGFAWERIVEP
ncbi:MAG: AAA family ATPase [Gammaproteobacteria bacterium]|nr:AAA family ATPase [Gammaproteobacteria bacterium]MCP5195482.1 AAA family ATPase [Gammaproteobacteria bacterium]